MKTDLSQYDQLNRVTIFDMVIPQGTFHKSFSYNSKEELALSTLLGPSLSQTRNYSSDLNHNLAQLGTRTFGVNGQDDQISQVAGAAVGYNAARAISAYQGRNYTYDLRDQLTGFTAPGLSARYFYDGQNRRLSKRVNGVRTDFLWSGDQVLKETAPSSETSYLLGAGREAAFRDGQWSAYFTDYKGSIVGVSDSTGNLAAAFRYSDYGELEQRYGNPAIPRPAFGWNGEQFDQESGHIYMRNRTYDPGLGRFLQRDPIRLAGGLNMYAFCGGDPINRVDPSGLQPVATPGGINWIIRGAPRLAPALGAEAAGGAAAASAGPQILLSVGLAGTIWFIGNGEDLTGRLLNATDPVGNGGIINVTPGSASSLPNDVPPLPKPGDDGARKGPPPRVLQTGGNTFSSRAARGLNEALGRNLSRREWGRALEALKDQNGLRNDFHQTKILNNGDVVSTITGEVIDNLEGYIP